MSQIEFAKLASVSVGCLQGLETGTRATRDANLEKIAKAMGLTRKELLSPDQPARPPSSDPRLKNLTIEDLQIARLFHEALTEVRVSVKAQLRAAVDLARREADIEGALFPDAIERRTGRERRRAIGDDARRRELVQRLEQLAPAVLAQLDVLVDAGADEWSLAFAARVAKQPPEIRTVLANQIAHIEKRQDDDTTANAEKKSNKKKP